MFVCLLAYLIFKFFFLGTGCTFPVIISVIVPLNYCKNNLAIKNDHTTNKTAKVEKVFLHM